MFTSRYRHIVVTASALLASLAPAQTETAPVKPKAESPDEVAKTRVEQFNGRFPRGLGSFGLASGARFFLLNKSVQEDLKIDREQSERMRKFDQAVRIKYATEWEKERKRNSDQAKRDSEIRRAVREDMEKALANFVDKVLTKDQAHRFRQIDLQRQFLNVYFDEEVTKALGLSADRQKAVQDLILEWARENQRLFNEASAAGFGKYREYQEKSVAGAKQTMVKAIAQLSAEQKKRWQDVIGAPFPWDELHDKIFPGIEYSLHLEYEFEGPVRTTARMEPLILQHEQVQKDLKLTADQVAQLKKTQDSITAKYKDDLEKVNGEDRERGKSGAALRAAQDKELMLAFFAELKAEQYERLAQIQLQLLESKVFDDGEVRKQLALTDEQKKKVQALYEVEAKKVEVLNREHLKALQTNPTMDLEAMDAQRKKLEAVRKETIHKAAAEFSPEQRKTWDKLVGRPFEFKRDPFSFPRRND